MCNGQHQQQYQQQQQQQLATIHHFIFKQSCALVASPDFQCCSLSGIKDLGIFSKLLKMVQEDLFRSCI